MGYDFKNASRQEFRFNIFAWPCALTLAKNFDWKPIGTVLRDFTVRVPDELDISNEEYIRKTVERWDGEYCANEWQLVEEEDALNLAFALMIAVKVLPDEDDDSTIVHSIDHWSGADNKKILKDFIKYCMGGEFAIL